MSRFTGRSGHSSSHLLDDFDLTSTSVSSCSYGNPAWSVNSPSSLQNKLDSLASSALGRPPREGVVWWERAKSRLRALAKKKWCTKKGCHYRIDPQGVDVKCYELEWGLVGWKGVMFHTLVCGKRLECITLLDVVK